MELLNASLVDWSKAQFALTAMYHWLFVPLTLGLGVIMCIMESLYLKTGDEEWKKATQFWMSLFGVNFAIGVATGIILEFEFGTNWSNYSWFVGDIFGAPLAIEGIMAFFMEATFISIMFFGWNKVSKRFHLVSSWLTVFGATLSALWILVANAWMQYPVGMEFNPATVRNEMIDFWSILLSPVAINKFTHTVLSGWVMGALFVMGVSGWFLIKKRDISFALRSMQVAAIFGLVASLLVAYTGDGSAMNVVKRQPMKLAAMEGLYDGGKGAGLIAFGVLNSEKKSYKDNIDPFIFKIEMPKMLSFLAYRDFTAYLPGIKNIIEGDYTTQQGTKALSFSEKQVRGTAAIASLSNYQKAIATGDTATATLHKAELKENFGHFGYGYFDKPEDTIPNVPMVFYSFHLMVLMGMYFIGLFALVLFFIYFRNVERANWLWWICLLSIPLGYIAGELGWIVAEVGRQPWAIQDVLPVKAAISSISTDSVKITFFLFLFLFTALLAAEVRILLQQIKKGPETV